MRHASWFLLLGGCGLLQKCGDKFVDDLNEILDPLTNPVVIQGVVLTFDQPSDPLLRDVLESSVIDAGVQAEIYLGNASSAGNLDDSMLPGATVSLVASSTVPALEDPERPGIYNVTPSSGLFWEEGAIWSVEAKVKGQGAASRLAVELPPSANVVVPELHEANTPMTLDFSGQGFQSALAFVFAIDGTITYSNNPQTAEEAFGLASRTTDITNFEIPAEAFPDDNLYLVAVGGMRHSQDLQAKNVNQVISNLMAGRMQLFPVVIGSSVLAQGTLLDVELRVDPAFASVLERADILPGTTATVFVADAADRDGTLEEAAVEDALVFVNGDERVQAENLGEGNYVVPAGELSWQVDEEWTVEVIAGATDGVLRGTLPEGMVLVPPLQHRANTPVPFDLTGRPYDAVFFVVVDEDGETTWSNEPTTAEEYAALLTDPPPMGPTEVPGSAFPRPGVYAMGIGGLRFADPATFDGLATDASGLMAGRMVFHPMTVTP
jgi:hypothetical protein